MNGGIELLHMFSPTLVNEVKFGYNRGTADTFDLNQTGIPYPSVSGGIVGGVSYPDLTTLAQRPSQHRRRQFVL